MEGIFLLSAIAAYYAGKEIPNRKEYRRIEEELNKQKKRDEIRNKYEETNTAQANDLLKIKKEAIEKGLEFNIVYGNPKHFIYRTFNRKEYEKEIAGF